MDESFTVTNGLVEYEHKKPRADYENLTPKVSLSFTVAAGSDPQAVAAKVMLMAVNIVEAAVNGKAFEAAMPEPKAPVAEVEPKKGKRAAPIPTVPAAVPSAPASTSAPTPNVTLLIEEVEDEPSPTAPTSDALAPGVSAPASSAASMAGVDAEDEDAELLGLTRDEPAPADITDEDLQKKVGQPLSAKLRTADGNINQLRALIQAAGGGTVLTAIPQANRPGFMEKAKALLASL